MTRLSANSLSALMILLLVIVTIAACAPVPFGGCQYGMETHEISVVAMVNGVPSKLTTAVTRCAAPRGTGDIQ